MKVDVRSAVEAAREIREAYADPTQVENPVSSSPFIYPIKRLDEAIEWAVFIGTGSPSWEARDAYVVRCLRAKQPICLPIYLTATSSDVPDTMSKLENRKVNLSQSALFWLARLISD